MTCTIGVLDFIHTIFTFGMEAGSDAGRAVGFALVASVLVFGGAGLILSAALSAGRCVTWVKVNASRWLKVGARRWMESREVEDHDT